MMTQVLRYAKGAEHAAADVPSLQQSHAGQRLSQDGQHVAFTRPSSPSVEQEQCREHLTPGGRLGGPSALARVAAANSRDARIMGSSTDSAALCGGDATNGCAASSSALGRAPGSCPVGARLIRLGIESCRVGSRAESMLRMHCASTECQQCTRTAV
jgi:hypothetical protein